MDARGGCGVEAGEDAMEPARGLALGAAGEAVAERLLAGGAIKEAHGECAKVEAGAAGDDGQLVAGGDGCEGSAGQAGVVAGGEGGAGIADVDEVVGELGLLSRGGLGGAEVHPAIDGHRVATDDFALEELAEGEREGGFPAAGGAHDEDGERLGGAGGYHRHQP